METPPSVPHQVLIVEDDRAFRGRFQSVLSTELDAATKLQVVAAVDSVSAGLAVLRSAKVDVLLVDLGLPDGDGTELIRAAAQLQPACVCMVVTVFGDEEHVVRAIEAGASGYLLKDAGAQDVCEALRDLLQGGSPINPMVARLVLQRMRAPALGPASTATDIATADAEESVGLSEREIEILTLIAKGFSFGEICGLLSITVNTVKTHVNRSYRKLGVHSRSQAVHEATRLGLIEM